MNKTHWLDILTFGLPLVGLVILSIVTRHPIMWATTAGWALIGGLLLYWRTRK